MLDYETSRGESVDLVELVQSLAEQVSLVEIRQEYFRGRTDAGEEDAIFRALSRSIWVELHGSMVVLGITEDDGQHKAPGGVGRVETDRIIERAR